MAEVWGALAKAQDNNQTIAEAIAEAIANHESDSSAHLGIGESLEAHKTSEVIDHLAGSIVADKITNLEKVWVENFDTSSKWDIVGYANFSSCPGVALSVEYGDVVTSAIYNKDVVFNKDIDWSKYLMVEFMSQLDKDGTIKYRCGIGNFSGGLENRGLGFYCNNGVLYGYYKNGSVVHNIDLNVNVVGSVKYLRAEYNPDTETATWFCNNVQVGSYQKTEANITTSFDVSFYLNTTNGSQSYLFIRNTKIVEAI